MPRMVGPLPLREGPRSHEGRTSHSVVRRLETGASPCWQHVMRFPLPAATASACETHGAGNVFDNPTSNLSPGVTRRGRDESSTEKALVSSSCCLLAPRADALNRFLAEPRTHVLDIANGDFSEQQRVLRRAVLLEAAVGTLCF